MPAIITKPTKLPPGLQLVSNRGQILGATALGGGSYTRNDSRFKMTLGYRKASDFRVAYGNYYANGTSADVAPPNAITLETGIEIVSPAAYTQRALFSGNNSITLQPGAPIIMSDPVALDVAPAGIVYVRTGLTVASVGQQWPTGFAFSATGESRVDSTASTSQVTATGGQSTPSGGNAVTGGYGPLALLGIPDKRYPALYGFGDSIGAGTGDLGAGDSNGNIGFLARAAFNSGLPYFSACRASDKATYNVSGTGSWRRAMLRYTSHVLYQMGTNDVGGFRTLAQLQADTLALWASFRARGQRIYATTLLPRTTSTDAWATTANQTVFSAAYAVGGIRDQYNAWLLTKAADGTIDGVIDVCPAVESASAPSKWQPGLTADGTHPVSAGHIAMASIAGAKMATFAVN